MNPVAVADTATKEHTDLNLRIDHGVRLRRLGRIDESVAELSSLLSHHPHSIPVKLELSVSRRLAEDFSGSLSLINDVLSKTPGHRQALLAKVDTLARFGHTGRAWETTCDALKCHPQDPIVLMKQGVLLRQMGRIEESSECLKMLHAAQPDNVAIAHELSLSLARAGRLEGSLEITSAILARIPRHKAALITRIETLAELQKLHEIQEFLDTELRTNTQSADHESLSAELICRMLTKLRGDDSRDGFLRALPRIDAAVTRIPVSLLWAVYKMADQVGLGQAYRNVAQEIIHRIPIGLAECLDMMAILYFESHPNWEDLCSSCIGRLAREDAGRATLEMISLTSSAHAALDARKTMPRPSRQPKDVIALAKLLKLAGKVRLAHRYLRRMYRQFPGNIPILQELVLASIDSGEGEQAQAEMNTACGSAFAKSPQFMAMAARCYVQLDMPERAREMIEGIEHPRIRRDLMHIYFRVLLQLGAVDSALDQAENLRTSGIGKFSTRFSPSLEGLLYWDLKSGNCASPFQSISGATKVIHNWRNRIGLDRPEVAARTSVPRTVFQYWNTTDPPEDVATIMQSWRSAPDFVYKSFDRRHAKSFLGTELGPNWVQALKLAGSPVEESDYFRLCYLMVKGGIYADCDDRLVGNASDLLTHKSHLTVLVEPLGQLGNNFLMAAPRHPAIACAAVSARNALLRRDNESTWAKAGPGLLTRAVAHYIVSCEAKGKTPDLTIIPRWKLGRVVQFHTPLPYKRSRRYWNSQRAGGRLQDLAECFRRQASPDHVGRSRSDADVALN